MKPLPEVRSLKSMSGRTAFGVSGLAPSFLSSLVLGVVGVRGASPSCYPGLAKGEKRENWVLWERLWDGGDSC